MEQGHTVQEVEGTLAIAVDCTQTPWEPTDVNGRNKPASAFHRLRLLTSQLKCLKPSAIHMKTVGKQGGWVAKRLSQSCAEDL